MMNDAVSVIRDLDVVRDLAQTDEYGEVCGHDVVYNPDINGGMWEVLNDDMTLNCGFGDITECAYWLIANAK